MRAWESESMRTSPGGGVFACQCAITRSINPLTRLAFRALILDYPRSPTLAGLPIVPPQEVLRCETGGIVTTSHAQLVQDMRDVVLDRLQLHVELAGDRLVAVATLDAAQNFQLTGGKARHRQPPPSSFAQKLEPNQPVERRPKDFGGAKTYWSTCRAQLCRAVRVIPR